MYEHLRKNGDEHCFHSTFTAVKYVCFSLLILANRQIIHILVHSNTTVFDMTNVLQRTTL